MKLIGSHYIYGENIMLGVCQKCDGLALGKIRNESKMKCGCGTTTIDRKLPLYHLINNRYNMIIYHMTHRDTGKGYVGVVITSATSKQNNIVDRDIQRMMQHAVIPELCEDIEREGMSAFRVEILSTPDTLSKAMIEEKLYISTKKTMKPDGYNTSYSLEHMLKRKIK